MTDKPPSYVKLMLAMTILVIATPIFIVAGILDGLLIGARNWINIANMIAGNVVRKAVVKQ